MNPAQDEADRLAAATRDARARYQALDRCGHPVLTSTREAALAAIKEAEEAEADYWRARSPHENAADAMHAYAATMQYRGWNPEDFQVDHDAWTAQLETRAYLIELDLRTGRVTRTKWESA